MCTSRACTFPMIHAPPPKRLSGGRCWPSPAPGERCDTFSLGISTPDAIGLTKLANPSVARPCLGRFARRAMPMRSGTSAPIVENGPGSPPARLVQSLSSQALSHLRTMGFASIRRWSPRHFCRTFEPRSTHISSVKRPFPTILQCSSTSRFPRLRPKNVLILHQKRRFFDLRDLQSVSLCDTKRTKSL